jgi:hypothetical protein
MRRVSLAFRSRTSSENESSRAAESVRQDDLVRPPIDTRDFEKIVIGESCLAFLPAHQLPVPCRQRPALELARHRTRRDAAAVSSRPGSFDHARSSRPKALRTLSAAPFLTNRVSRTNRSRSPGWCWSQWIFCSSVYVSGLHGLTHHIAGAEQTATVLFHASQAIEALDLLPKWNDDQCVHTARATLPRRPLDPRHAGEF